METRIVAALISLFLAAAAWAQPGRAALEKARLVAEAEGNPAAAAGLFQALAEDEKQDAAVRAEAWLGLAGCLERLGQPAEAKAALARAAAGGGEAAERAKAWLEGRAEQGGPHLEERVAAAIRELAAGNEAVAQERLAWIGRPAVPFLVRAIEADPLLSKKTERLLAIVMALGGPEAVGFIEKARRSPDPLYRRCVVLSIVNRAGVGKGATPEVGDQATLFLDDPDPGIRAEVLEGVRMGSAPLEVLQAFLQAHPERLLALARNPAVRVRNAFWLGFMRELFLSVFWESGGGRRRGFEIPAAVWEELFACLAADPDPAVPVSFVGSLLAWEGGADPRSTILEFLFRGPASGELLLSVLARPELEEFLVGIKLPSLGDLKEAPSPDRTLETSRVLGPWPRDGSGLPASNQYRRQLFALIVAASVKAWEREAMPRLLELLRLGYANGVTLDWILGEVVPEELPALVSAMLDSPLPQTLGPKIRTGDRSSSVARWLGKKELTPPCWPVVKAGLESWLKAGAGEGREGGARRDAIAFAMFLALGTRLEEAASYVAEAAAQQPDFWETAATLLLKEEGSWLDKALLAVLAAPGPAGVRDDSLRAIRCCLFVKVLEAGIPGAERAFARAYAHGLATRPEGDRVGFGYIPFVKELPSDEVGLGLFFAGDPITHRQISPYTPEQVASIVEACLQARLPAPWYDVRRSMGTGGALPNSFNLFYLSIPDPVVWVLYRNLLSCPVPEIQYFLLDRLLDRNWLGQRPALLPAARELADRIADARDPALLKAFKLADPTQLPGAIPKLHWALDGTAGPCEPFAVRFLAESRDPAILPLLLSLLKSKYPQDRGLAAGQLITHFAGAALPSLLPLCEDPDPMVRRALANNAQNGGVPALELANRLIMDDDAKVALAAIGSARNLLDATSIPFLLEALRRQDSGIQKAAREALESLRFYLDQKAWWDRWLAASGLGANPAEALANQAGPDQPRKIRFAAIAALGVLSDPDSQPFLIRLMQDQDAEIAAAAEKALLRIQEAPAPKR